MKIKHWDKELQQWVIDGASNASNLELSNPGFLDSDGKSVSIDQGMTKVHNRLTKLEQNLAWVYINGAKGGTGTGTGEEVAYTINVAEGSTVYTSTGSVTLNILITSGTIAKSFTVVAKDVTSGTILGTWKKYSMSRTSISLDGLDGNVSIELSAYDANLNYATPTYVTVIAGAIKLSIQSTPPKTIVRGGISTVPALFTITNNISGAKSNFYFKINSLEADTVLDITTATRSLTYNIRDLIFNNILFPTVNAGQKFTFEAYATTALGTSTLTSNVITFNVTVSESNSLIIVTEDITETDTYDSLATFSKGSQLSFSYYLSYAPTTYSTFNVNYKVYTMNNGVKVSDTPIVSGDIPNVTKSITNIFALSTVKLDETLNGNYLMIEMFGSAVSNPDDITGQYTKRVYCKISEAVRKELYANNDMQTLLAYFSRVTGFPNNTTGTWTYPVSTSGAFPYQGTFKNSFPEGVKLTLKDVNGSTTGFIANSDNVNSIPAIILKGESYGYLDVAEQMFPNYEISEGYSFFQTQGFNISITYRAEESSSQDEVIMSIGNYLNNELYNGIEISLDKVKIGIGAADSIEVKLPQNELLTVDIDVSLLGTTSWYFKIYVNGVLSAVTRVEQSNIHWTFGTNLFLGCRSNGGNLSNFSNVNIYDLKLYTSSQTEYAIVQNYISAIEQASLVLGEVDNSLDSELRTKNLFDSEGNCLIWNKDTQTFYDGQELYGKLIAQMKVNTPYPVVLVEEDTLAPTNFKAFSTATWTSGEGIMDKTFPAKITFNNKLGSTTIATPSGVAATNGVRIGLQGTSSLSYNAKNFELYMGHMDETGKDLLFQPTEDWLPENEFTLKADVMDSAHVNNVVIGKIINGAVTNELGVKVVPFSATPPMLVSDSVFPDAETATSIKSRIRHTSDGFPCLLFIKFAPDKNTGISEFRFCGIYNFNLGRYAYYNLGLKLLTSFTRTNQVGPSLISDFTSIENYWNTDESSGVFSAEIGQNNSAQGAFQQDDLEIVKYMAGIKYTSQNEDKAYAALQKMYTQTANMALSTTQKYTMSESGEPTKLINGTYSPNNPAYYTFSSFTQHMNWENACSYFILALVFGMVDSMCKNMTFRSWGSNVWYPAFYDMDTAFGLNNKGQDIVEYWAHLHRWYNIQTTDTGITTFTSEKNYANDPDNPDPTRPKQYFACWWNRIWEILENLPLKDSSGIGDGRATIESTYVNLRTNLFPDPEKFIEKYYKSYTDTTGSIIFNYDYKIKYLKIEQSYNTVTEEYTDLTSFAQLGYLHGNRVMRVKDWFVKRIKFLDGVYGVEGTSSTLPVTVESPVNQGWVNNKATGLKGVTQFVVGMSAASRILYRWAYDKSYGSFWLDEDLEEATVPIPGGETIVAMYANKYITRFDNFKGYPWTSLTEIDFPLLEKLDLTGLVNIPYDSLFKGGVYYETDGVSHGLKNIRELILANVKVTGSSAYTLDVSNCSKLQTLDISGSSITNVTLPKSPVLKNYNLSNTGITTLTLKDQSFLSSLNIDGCTSLTSIVLDNCGSLKSLTVPQNVKTITIQNCESLESLNLIFVSTDNSISQLTKVMIDNCPGLKVFNISGQNNPSLEINLVGAKNLEDLDLSNIKTTNILLAPLKIGGVNNFTSLKSLNISGTNITNLIYGDNAKDSNGNYIALGYLDLFNFPNLENILATNCKKLTKVVCKNDQSNPIELNNYSFYGCDALKRVIGHYSICGIEVFRGCSNLILNDPEVYNTVETDVFLTANNTTNISFKPTIENIMGCFNGCSNLSSEDFRRIMIRIPNSVTSIEATFKNCYNVNCEIWRGIFSNCRNLISLKESFSNCGITGVFYSRKNNFNQNDETTWGILDYLQTTDIIDMEGAFESTLLTWIDNKVFAPKIVNGITVYSQIAKADHMFRNCSLLKSCEDTNIDITVAGTLDSETFFLNLRNLISTYPDGVFSGCQNIRMAIKTDAQGNTLLFHSLRKVVDSLILTDSLYAGIKLEGTIGENVFGGVSQTISYNGVETYYIPTFSSIQYPFINSSNNLLTMDLSKMSKVFRGIGSTLAQAIGAFSGIKLIGTKTIPADIFKNCSVLNSIESLFSGLGINNNGSIYTFPATYDDNGETKGMFDDCYKLMTTRNLFANEYNLQIQLVGEGFKNCQLRDVSGMFSNSGLFGIIPYRLFFMKKSDNTINQTITNMDKIFYGCWCLGYDSSRKIDLEFVLSGLGTSESPYIYSSWNDHIVKSPGNKMSYKLDVNNMTKSYNFDRNEIEYIQYTADFASETKYTLSNGVYSVYDTSNITFYTYNSGIYTVTEYNGYSIDPVYTKSGDVYTLYTVPQLYVKNPEYNPGEYAYDPWYLDGYGWEGATTIDVENDADANSLVNQKSRLYNKYFKYDDYQKQAILYQNTGFSVDSHQNYIIPTDLFRYCDYSCTLSGVIEYLNWYKNEAVFIQDTNTYKVSATKTIEGLTGRIPVKLFQALTTSTKFDSVFKNARLDAFYGLREKNSTLVRGLMYPPDLFDYNISLTDLISIFYNTKIPVGVDVNSDLFVKLTSLRNVSNMWANCIFDKRPYNADSFDSGVVYYPQFNFSALFEKNTKISNASGLFAVTDASGDVAKGLLMIEATLLQTAINITNISNMFYYNSSVVGNVPLFNSATYRYIGSYVGYLSGVIESNIVNRDSVETRLRPIDWSQK